MSDRTDPRPLSKSLGALRARRSACAAVTVAAVTCSLAVATPAYAALAPGADGAWRFDFGTAKSPVATGYQQVLTTSLYTPERGWGITVPEGITLFDRDRTGNRTPADPLAEDFVAGTSWGFNLDGVADGTYNVTVTLGDALAGTSGTNATVSLEGVAQTRLTTGKAETTVHTFTTAVSDGQLTVGLTGTGLGAYVNGIVVEPARPATPGDLTATKVGWNSVELTWGATAGAASYRVLRAPVAGETTGDFAEVGTSDKPSFSDTSVATGSTYAYVVEALDAKGVASVRTSAVTAGPIPELTKPEVPAGLAVTQVTDNRVVLSWTATENADEYLVERAGTDGVFAEAGTVTAATFTDEIDTSEAWTYRVSARNAAGSSAVSEAVTSAAYAAPAPLPTGDVVSFDFGPGAVADGALAVTSSTAFGDWGYGFSTAPTAQTPDVDRGGSDALRSDHVSAGGGTFEVDLAPGDYIVGVVAGDAKAASDIAITAEKMAKVTTTTKAAGEYLEMSFPIALVDGRLTLEVTGAVAALAGLTITRQAPRTAGALTTTYLAGDSTVQTYTSTYEPQAGWGQMIERFLADDVVVANHAIGGRSSKNFITQGRLDEVLRAIRPGDYLMVQFGHNDATQGVDDRYASPADYKEYLRTYVEGARQRGAEPILVTPVSRRSYAADGTANVSFPEYVAKMKELAAEEGVLLVDLSASSRAYLTEIGAEAAKAVFLHVDPGVFAGRPSGTVDDTHFQEYGAIAMARLVAEGVQALDTPLASKVADVAPPADAPVAPANLVAGSVSNAGAQLQWTASPGADIYKVYRQAVLDPEQTWSLVTYTTQTSVIAQGLLEGTSYRYRVVATNGRGDSPVSDTVTITTKQAKWKFDFQPAGSALQSGYTEVNRSMKYTEDRGFGFTNIDGLGDRDRGSGDGANNLQRDFILPGDKADFVLDVPNGTYSVKTYSGDWIGSTRTDFALEGISFGSGNAGKGAVNETVRGPVLVTDGQLTITASGTAAGTRLNGIEVTPILLGPTGLEVTNVDADPENPAVSLAWDAQDTMTYNVYRTQEFDTERTLIARVTDPSFIDRGALVGFDYDYTVTAIDPTGLESVPSQPVTASLIDPDVTPPAAPTNLSVVSIDKRKIELSWARPVDALSYLVFRSEVKGERGTLVDVVGTDRITDTNVLTTIPYYYTVIAVNAGGQGAASAALSTEAVTTLQRQAEYLDRAPAAVTTDDGVLVSWRMLGTDPDAISFHVYRDGTRITAAPITDSTNLLDADGTASSSYRVSAITDGREVTVTENFSVQTGAYKAVKLDKPADAYAKDGQPYTYSANDMSVGDVDGDGEYELIVKWDPSNSKDNSQGGYTGNVYLDAYRMDGTRLWRIDLGVNIRAGAHYTQFQVFDYDGNGRAEVIVKTADGTIDATGQPIGRASADYRNSSGYVLDGPEYLTVFEGLTGRAIDTVDYVPARGDVGAWGDAYGNRVDRFLAATAYLDGEHPSAIFSRGYYTRAVVAAYDFDGSKLKQRWVLDSNDAGNGALYGMGNHNLSVADVDGDAKDEIVFGSATIDDNGTLLYSTGLGHGDAIHVSDLVPSNPGLEVFAAQEDMGRSGNRGATMRDARTGEVLFSIPATKDTGRAASADIDPAHPGAESWAVGGDAAWNSTEGYLLASDGTRIGSKIPAANFLAWFDGDALREIVDHDWDATATRGVGTVGKWNPETGKTDRLLTAEGLSNNGTKGTPNLQADLFGDWREEIAWRSADSSELRIYSTTDETDIRVRTLMHDPVYRLSVAWQNTGYNQPPQTSFFLGDGFTQPAAPHIAVTGAPTGSDTTAPVVTGVPANGTLLPESASLDLQIVATDPESDVRNLDVTFDGEPVSPTAKISLNGLAGAHTLTVNAVNHAGLVTRVTSQITVYPVDSAKTAPGRGVLSSTSGWASGLHDGTFAVNMNLWSGVNGSVFRLYENGELIHTRTLTAASPAAQTATVQRSGLVNGTYVYTGELINAVGTTATTSVTVKVKDAAPGTPVVSHDNYDKDGNYIVTTDMWWGTNATSYRLRENGVVIDEQPLVAASPDAQRARTQIAARTPGTYEYVAEFSNAAGTTVSKAVRVTVTK